MASPTKRGRFEESVTKMGYVHNVSPIKTNLTGTVNYFTAQLQQDRETFQRVVCFNSNQHAMFADAEKKKSPVKLANCQLTASYEKDATHDVKFNTRSQISLTEELHFNFRKPVHSTLAQLQSKDVNIKDFLTLGSMEKGNLTAKVVNIINNEEAVNTKFGARLMKKVLLSDGTGTMSCSIWEEKRLLVKEGATYLFTDLSLRQYMGTQYASTTQSSKINQVQDIPVVAKACESQVVHQIEGVEVSKTTKCPSCNTALTAAAGQRTIKCTSCKKRCVTEMLQSHLKCTMKITISNVSKEFFVPSNVIKDLMKKMGSDSTDTDSIEEELLVGGPYRVTYHQKELLGIELEKSTDEGEYEIDGENEETDFM